MAAQELLSGDGSFSIQEKFNTTVFNNQERTSTTTKPIWSLKPFAKTAAETPTFPPLTGESEPYLGQRMRNGLKVHFEAWNYVPRMWYHWRDRVSQKQAITWKRARIHQAIQSSMYHAPPKPHFVLELVRYWCPSSNTFVFPWGEATITLEDVWVLGGYSVLGVPVSLPLPMDSDELELLDRMLEFQIDMFDRDPESEKSEQKNWMEYFLDENAEKNEEHDEELEHIAFLSMWLSRFVFPFKDPENAINREVFGIAIHLSRGTRLALAPAVLAGVYHSMSLLKEMVFFPVIENALTVIEFEKIAGSFELIHHWALERFSGLAPIPRPLERGQPRAARWHKTDLSMDRMKIKDDLKSDDNNKFEWRPYANDMSHWSSHYRSDNGVVGNGLRSEKELSFGVCLCACELEGVAGVPNKKYMPHRVAKQFGMDQHFSGKFAVMKPERMNLFRFFVPNKDYKVDESVEYYNWWKQSWQDYELEDNFQAARFMGAHYH